MPATQAVAIRRDTSIRYISTEGVDDKLASIREVGYGPRRAPPALVMLAGAS